MIQRATEQVTLLQSLAAAAQATIQGLLDGDEPAAAGAMSGRPIILLHGFAATSRVLLPLERHLRRTLRRPVVRLRLGNRIPLNVHDVRTSARSVYAAIERGAAAPEFEYADVVGHSMGGLIAAYLLKSLDRGRRIRRVVTLGTPHRGTPLALLGVLMLGALSRAVWQMLPGSPLLRELARLPVPAGSQILSISAGNDSVVPPTFARVVEQPGQENDYLPRLNHFELLHSPAVLDRICRILADHADQKPHAFRDAA